MYDHVRQKVADRVQRPEAEVDQEPRSNDTASPQKQKAVVGRALRVWAVHCTHRAGMDMINQCPRCGGGAHCCIAHAHAHSPRYRVICTFCQSNVLLQCSK